MIRLTAIVIICILMGLILIIKDNISTKEATIMSNVKTVTAENFESEVLKSEQPVLVDFYADWCGPCKALSPTIDKVAEAGVGKFKVVKLNTDDSPEIARQYKVRGIPTLIVFRGGEAVKTQVGGSSMDNIVKLVTE